MSNLSDIIIAALAAWRLALMVTREEGPVSLNAKLRDRFPKGWVGRGLRCVWCTGFWFALVITPGPLVDRLAAAALVGLIDGIIPEGWKP